MRWQCSGGASNAFAGGFMSHLALYGNVKMVRAYCSDCEQWALVVGRVIQCCDREVEVEPKTTRRMSEPEYCRRVPLRAEQIRILNQQGHRCLYCDLSFDGYVEYRQSIRKVKINWDHMVPYTYTANNHHENFAAACQFCNAWKSSLIFKTVDEVRIYVSQKWATEKARNENV